MLPRILFFPLALPASIIWPLSFGRLDLILNLKMINAQFSQEEKSCNCRNSKCMKLYCQCFAANLQCTSNCHCLDCQNKNCNKSTILPQDRMLMRRESIKSQKGCACKRSGCLKKYCECYQSGMPCKQTCKCTDCQNNETVGNKSTIMKLKNGSNIKQHSKISDSLYSLYISQNAEHLVSIIQQANPLQLSRQWLETSADCLFRATNRIGVIGQMLGILQDLDRNLSFQKDEKQRLGNDNEDKVEELSPPNLSSEESQEEKLFVGEQLVDGEAMDQEISLESNDKILNCKPEENGNLEEGQDKK